MNRRTFLQTIAMGIGAATAVGIQSARHFGETRAIIDEQLGPHLQPVPKPLPKPAPTPLYRELWAADGDELSELMTHLAPGGTLYVHRVTVRIDKTITLNEDYRIDMRHALVMHPLDVSPSMRFVEPHVSGEPHTVMYCMFLSDNWRKSYQVADAGQWRYMET